MSKGRKSSLKESLNRQESDYNRYSFSIPEYLQLSGIAFIYLAAFIYVFYRSLILFLICLPFIFAYPFFKKAELIKKRKQRLLTEFKEGLLILSAFVSAGYSIENAVKESISELNLLFGKKSLIVKEFCILDKKIMMNKNIEQSIEELATRSGLEEIDNFAAIIKVAKRNGGSLTNIFEHSVKIISDKINIKEEIITLISAKIFEQKLMNLFPLVMILYIDFSSKNYFKQMYDGIMGRMIMSISLLAYIIAIVLANKIMDIKV